MPLWSVSFLKIHFFQFNACKIYEALHFRIKSLILKIFVVPFKIGTTLHTDVLILQF